jgi:hypothetical protein
MDEGKAPAAQSVYKAVHTVCDKKRLCAGSSGCPGNVHDSAAFDDIYDKVTQTFPEIETIVADAQEKRAMQYTHYRGLA